VIVELKNPRLDAALEAALRGSPPGALFAEMERGSGLPGPRANADLAAAVAARVAAAGRRGDGLLRALLDGPEFAVVVAVHAFAARWRAGVDAPGASQALQDLCEHQSAHVRAAIVDVVRARLGAGAAALSELDAWLDGFLQAHTVLAALVDRETLAAMGAGQGSEVIARLDTAFSLADSAPRAADRSQGLRTLRRDLPAQIAAVGRRWPDETMAWVEARSAAKHPETRAVLARTLELMRAQLAPAERARLAGALSASAKPPRDPSRIVQGTRRRGKR
jgi:hypothetical protein